MHIYKNKITCTAYSSDGSIYEVTPESVIQVESAEDIRKAVRYALKQGKSITPRGGGTGLTGGALGDGVIIDFGLLKDIIEINRERMTVLTQVGIIFEELNTELERYDLFFPPDPSSGDSCQIGGMLANNSSGTRSVKYGLTSDFVEELHVVDASGAGLVLKKLKIGSEEQEQFFNENPAYARVFELLKSNAGLIRERWPRLKKNSSGYNLLQVLNGIEDGYFDLPALMIGSEGTLSIIAAARLRLLPIPEEKITARLYFKSLLEAGKAVAPILKSNPSGLEIVDGATLDLIGRGNFNIPPEAAAMLLIEFDDEVGDKKRQLQELAGSMNLAAPADFAADAEGAAALWKARKAIVPTLYRHHATRRPISLVEDVSLPPEEIPSFIEFLTDLFGKYRLTFGVFGHIGDGNLHIRPLFDLNKKDEFGLAQEIYRQVYDRVIAVGGSSTAEHADGRLRAPVVKQVYGEEIYAVFMQIKSLLDPGNVLSPDSILSTAPFTDKIDYEKIKSFCAACGKCNGYCPAYDLFRREDFSPRGWLRIINQSGASQKLINEYLQFCLNCKNCADVCPAGVDIASEIINYRSQRPSIISKMAAAFADNESMLNLSLRMGRLAEPLLNSDLGKSAIRLIGGSLFGLDDSTQFPPIAARTLQERFADRLAGAGEVAFFHGCADNLLVSSVGEAVFKVFDRLGVRVSIPEQKCCGLPYEVYGHRDKLIEKARFNIDCLLKFKSVITGCASCLLRLKEYERLFDDGDEYKRKAEELSVRCYDISQYINTLVTDPGFFDLRKKYIVTYHNPCHLRAAGLHKEPEKLLTRFENIEIKHPVHADRCCAQAGSYGFIHFQEAKQMFAKKKKDYENIVADYIMTSCPACQMKIRAEVGGNFKVVHPVEILADMIE
ncbi:MAG TPA: FAD-binding oxidoreductase [candidate division Zixibacteria bacterium]|nr:FAD-binding oxidoreductase [candidate division Zixibacteria bacterium]